MKRIVLVFFFFLSITAAAEPWRIYTGGYGTAWHTTDGHHGHDVDCPPEEQHDRCESSDFARANLDNSIGFRLGAEQRRSWLVYGAELNLDSTEYNISQRDLYIGSAVVTAGAATEFFHVTFGLRGGAGLSASDDGHFGGIVLAQASADVPLTGAVQLRIAHRESAFLLSGESLRSRDTSLLMVFAETPSTSRWRFSAGAGVSFPGDLDLSRAPFTRLAAARRMTDRTALGISYITAAHESTRKTVFMGYPDNERGKTITGVGVDWTMDLSFVELGLGAEVADWSDEHQLLGDVSGGIDVAPAVKVGIALPIRDGLAVVFSAEQLYWLDIGLDETRLGVSLATR